MRYKPLPPLEELREYLDYNPDTGILTWKKSSRGTKTGQEAGSLKTNGYRQIQFKREKWFANRLVYYMHHGIDPLKNQVDHINRNRLDNRIENLRLVTPSQNLMNSGSYKNNTSGFKGVYWDKSKKEWRALIIVNGKRKHLGNFINKEDAIQAREEAEIKYFGDFRSKD